MPILSTCVWPVDLSHISPGADKGHQVLTHPENLRNHVPLPQLHTFFWGLSGGVPNIHVPYPPPLLVDRKEVALTYTQGEEMGLVLWEMSWCRTPPTPGSK